MGKKTTMLQTDSQSYPLVSQSHQRSLSLLEEAYKALVELSGVRSDYKLSNSRVTGVAREVNELIKVMAIYRH